MKAKIIAANARFATQVEALLNELSLLSDELLNRKPRAGGWSAIQTLHHLILVEEASLVYIHKKLSFNPILKKSGFGAWIRNLLLQITLRSPLKFKAPKITSNEHLPDVASLAETRTRWQKIRKEWAMFFENLPDELADKAVYRHPRAGRQNWLQMIDFLNAHFERHKAQVLRAVC